MSPSSTSRSLEGRVRGRRASNAPVARAADRSRFGTFPEKKAPADYCGLYFTPPGSHREVLTARGNGTSSRGPFRAGVGIPPVVRVAYVERPKFPRKTLPGYFCAWRCTTFPAAFSPLAISARRRDHASSAERISG